ncbi:WSC domain-containing protein [Mycena metata]|uniref:WSC domain-containing protein n=1 Tax=Mycena metata TaxID=1033252 RepID=A0AAD7NP52_9AGAR|nr:WSC domain-containing protein [Mycena metata]
MFSARLLPFALVLPSALAAHVHSKRALTQTAPAPWTLEGCYPDTIKDRVLCNDSYTDTKAMTLEACTWFCSSRQYPYAGLEYSQECYCGDALYATHGGPANASECGSACTGNSTEACGGNFRMQIYQNPNAYGASNPSPAAGDMGRWALQGCQTDKITMRTLPEPINNITGGMTPEKCVNACQNGGFKLAGCGHNLGNSTSAPTTDCNLRCAGNNTEICGGPNRLTVYKDMGAPATSSSPDNSTSVCLEQTTLHDFTTHVVLPDGSTQYIYVIFISDTVAILTVRDSLCNTDA